MKSNFIDDENKIISMIELSKGVFNSCHITLFSLSAAAFKNDSVDEFAS